MREGIAFGQESSWLAMVVMVSQALMACSTEQALVAKIAIPGPECGVGQCEDWRVDCRRTCTTFLPFLAERAEEEWSCGFDDGRDAGVPNPTWHVRCAYSAEVPPDLGLGSGRLPANYVLQVPRFVHSPRGAFFARAAEAEAVSVIAFREIADWLDDHGFAELATRARKAADEETAHCAVMTVAAARYGATPARPQSTMTTWPSVLAFACDNAVLGEVHEGWSAMLATYAAMHATQLDDRRAMLAVAADECGHLALSRDMTTALTATLSVEDVDIVRRARAHAIEKLTAQISRWPFSGPLVEHGLLPSRAQASALMQQLAHALAGVQEAA